MVTNSEWFNFRLDEDTRARLEHLSDKSGQSRSTVLRMLIHGTAIKEMPPVDYHKMNAELYHIGHNLNQIAKIANASGRVDAKSFVMVVKKLHQAILEIEKVVYLR